MKALLILAISCWAALPCHAAEIVAWKVPLSRFVKRGAEAEGIARCESAPEASPFFKEGDELWDLKGTSAKDRKETSPPLEWAIWNATSGRLVVKAEKVEIWQLCHRMGISDLPTQCRLKAEVFKVPANGQALDEKSKPSLFVSWLIPAGGDFDFTPADKSQKFKASGRAYISEDMRSVWTRIRVGFKLGEQTWMTLDSSLTLPNGKSTWVARDFDGEAGMDLTITPFIELEDGSPADKVMLIQKGNTAETIHVDRVRVKKYPLGDKRMLAFQHDTSNLLASVLGEQSEFDVVTPQLETMRKKWGIGTVQAPDSINEWFEGPVWDICGKMKEWDVISANSSAFAGYDPISNRLFLLSDETNDIDGFENLFQVLDGDCPKSVTVTLSGSGQTRVMMNDGSDGTIERTDDEENVIRYVQISPSMGEAEETVDVRLDYFDQSDSWRKGAFKTSVTSKSRASVEVMEASPENRQSFSMQLKAVAKDPLE